MTKKRLLLYTWPELKDRAAAAADETLRDRRGLGMILLVTSFLEHTVGSLLQKVFVSGNTSDSLLNPIDGFLGSFKSRCDVAYCLGLITARDKKDLETIGQIRNLVAHSVDDVAPFLRDDVRKLCEALDPRLYTDHWDEMVRQAEGADPDFAADTWKEHRARFIGVAGMLLNIIDHTHKSAAAPASPSPAKLDADGNPT